MLQTILTENRLTGLVLVMSMIIPISLGILLAFRPGFPAGKFIAGNLEGVVDYLGTQRLLLTLWALAMLCTLVGLAMLSAKLADAGARPLATAGVVTIAVVAALWAIELTFHMTVTHWAATETARTGTTPEMYQPFRQWLSVANQQFYIVLAMVSMTAFGLAINSTGILPEYLGLVSIGWAAIWTAMTLFTGDTIPATVFVMPAAFGVALLSRG